MSASIIHTPIMVKEITNQVPENTKLYIDGTAGHGGHIVAIAGSGKIAAEGHIIAVDRDGAMLEKCRQQTSGIVDKISVEYMQDSYATISHIL
jgi:16S rRNA C1402 N4-methylase RsmH